MRTKLAARTASQVLDALAAVTLILMMLHIVANAMLRKFANDPIGGTNEYVGYWYLPLVAFLGFIAAQRRDEHIEARLVFDRLPRINQRELDVFGLLLAAITFTAFAWFGWHEALGNREIGATSGATGVVIWPVTFVVPFAFGTLAVLVLMKVVAVARGKHDPAEDAGPVDIIDPLPLDNKGDVRR